MIGEFGQTSAKVAMVPGVDLNNQNSVVGLRDAALKLKVKKQKGTIKGQEYNRRMRILNRRLRVIEVEEEIEDELKRLRSRKGKK